MTWRSHFQTDSRKSTEPRGRRHREESGKSRLRTPLGPAANRGDAEGEAGASAESEQERRRPARHDCERGSAHRRTARPPLDKRPPPPPTVDASGQRGAGMAWTVPCPQPGRDATHPGAGGGGGDGSGRLGDAGRGPIRVPLPVDLVEPGAEDAAQQLRHGPARAAVPRPQVPAGPALGLRGPACVRVRDVSTYRLFPVAGSGLAFSPREEGSAQSELRCCAVQELVRGILNVEG